MNKFLKFALVFGILITVAGVVLLGVAIHAKAFENEYEKINNTYTLEEEFDNINIKTSTADIEFKISEDENTTVECIEADKIYHIVTVKDNTLTIISKDELKWYDRILNFNYINMKLTIYLNKTVFDKVEIKTSTGDITINNDFSFNTFYSRSSTGSLSLSANVNTSIDSKASTGNLNIKGSDLTNFSAITSTGHITLENINVIKDVTMKTTTGNVKLTNFICDSKLTVITSTGHITLDKVDANELELITSTGSIKGSLLTGKKFDAKSSTGTVIIPQSTESGLCYIRTSTGSINITIE